MESLLGYAVLLSIMGALGWLRKRQEAKADQQRMDEPKTSIDDLPEATRRQLYGESAQPIREARPAQRASQSAGPPAIRTARAKQQQAPSRREAPPRREAPARRATPTQNRGQQQTRQQQQAPQTTMDRMHSALHQMAESVQEQMDQMEGRPAPPTPPPPRRKPRKSPQQLAAEQAEHQQEARQKRAKAITARAQRQREMKAAITRKPSKHLLGDADAIRRGIILAEVLGTPKGLEF